MKKAAFLFICLSLLWTLSGCGVEYPEPAPEQNPTTIIEEEPDNSYNFLFLSDTAKSESNGYGTLKSMMELAAQQLPEISFILHGGDVVNPTDDGSEWMEYEDAMTAMADIPTYVSWGEKDDAYLTGHYQLPENGPSDLLHHFYSFSYENAHFIFLDGSYMGLHRDDYINWLKNDLTNSSRQWNIVICHFPLYPTVDIDNDLARANAQRDIWDSVLKEMGIDLVLSGHQHLYARTQPVTNGAISEGSPIHVMVNSGSEYSANASTNDYTAFSYTEGSNFCCFNIDDNQLTMTAYDQSMNELDSLSLSK